MGIGTALAFIAIGAILAFAFHFHVSGIDVQMIGWILIFVGLAMLLITLMYTRPRRRRQVIIDEEPPYVVEEPAYVVDEEPPTVARPAQPGVREGPVRPGSRRPRRYWAR